MRFIDNLIFDYDYLEHKKFNTPENEMKLFNMLTSDYMFKCDNYAVAYMFCYILDHLKMCEHSDITEDYYWPYSRVVFITCRPQDLQRMKWVARRIPSSIKANVRFYEYDEDGEEIEV